MKTPSLRLRMVTTSILLLWEVTGCSSSGETVIGGTDALAPASYEAFVPYLSEAQLSEAQAAQIARTFLEERADFFHLTAGAVEAMSACLASSDATQR